MPVCRYCRGNTAPFGYSHVVAPFDGIVSAQPVSVGELVGAASPTRLATIVQIDPIYVNFNVNEQDVLRIPLLDK
jgi:multidrug resistance efflux pump